MAQSHVGYKNPAPLALRPWRRSILGFLAYLDYIAFDVANLEEVGFSAALNGSSDYATTRKLFVRFLQLVGENYGNGGGGPVEDVILHFRTVTQQDSGFVIAWQLKSYIGREWIVPIRRDPYLLAIKSVDPPLLRRLDVRITKGH